MTIDHEVLGKLEIEYSTTGSDLRATNFQPEEYLEIEIESIENQFGENIDRLADDFIDDIYELVYEAFYEGDY